MSIAPKAEPGTLKRQLRQAQRRRQIQAFVCALPLLIFVLVMFVAPIGTMLFQSVDNPEVGLHLPNTAMALKEWDGQDLPGENAYAALTQDLKRAFQERSLALVGKRLNYEIPGLRSRIMETGRRLAAIEDGPYKPKLLALDTIWGERATWITIKRSAQPLTPFYLLSVLDLRLNIEGDIESADNSRAIFRAVFWRTFSTSVLVTSACLLIGFPVAYLLATVSTSTRNKLIILVILPFWTSLLVRTTGWIVLLQANGVINKVLSFLQLIDQPLELAYTRFAVVIAMTHILLPFMILPIFSVMKGISPTYMRAAASLGAGPVNSFLRIYLPQTVPGIGAGSLLVFILAIGYYITPVLVGGANDQMISYFVAFYINDQVNWGMAAALGTVLLVAVTVLYYAYNKVVGIDRMRLG